MCLILARHTYRVHRLSRFFRHPGRYHACLCTYTVNTERSPIDLYFPHLPGDPVPLILLQQPIHSLHMNICSVNHVMAIVSDKCFGPADIRQRVLEGSEIVDRKDEALSHIILSIRGDSFRGTRVLKGWVKCVSSMPVCS
jgi:hypothetical protein